VIHRCLQNPAAGRRERAILMHVAGERRGAEAVDLHPNFAKVRWKVGTTENTPIDPVKVVGLAKI